MPYCVYPSNKDHSQQVITIVRSLRDCVYPSNKDHSQRLIVQANKHLCLNRFMFVFQGILEWYVYPSNLGHTTAPLNIKKCIKINQKT